MKTEIIAVTPAMAKTWLEKNADFNRKVRQGVVERYARDMLNNNWTMTHQGIAFDSKGRLIDGQHRLHAVVAASIPVKMLVLRDVPTAAFDHVDLGYGRTAADVLRAEGEGWITNEHISMARLMEAGSNIAEVCKNRSPFELRDMVKEHANAIQFVLSNIERRVRGITVAPVLAAVAVAYYTELDRVRLAEFVRRLVDGVAIDPATDTVVMQLRDWLKDHVGMTSQTARQEMFLKTQRVIKAYMKGERLSKLYTPSEPVYPLRRHAVA